MAKTMEDFMLDTEPPRSIRDIVLEQIDYEVVVDKHGKKHWYPEGEESLDKLLNKVYDHIRAEALKFYRSNELWAIKAYCYDHILTDAVAREVASRDGELLNELVSPVVDWQRENFDPLLNFKRRMEAGEYAPAYISICLKTARELVLKFGKKTRYTEPELLAFLEELRSRYSKSSYATKVYQLKVFLDSLPEDEHGRKQQLPIRKYPSYPTEYYQPTFTSDELERQAAVAILDESPQSILRLLIAQIYAPRLGELAMLESKYINLDHSRPTITFLVEKRRSAQRVPVTQPIPVELLPFFAIPLKPRQPRRILADLKRICRKAGVRMPRRSGIHAIRRRVITELWHIPDLKELSIRIFLRWSTSYGMGVMPTYVQTPPEATNAEVLSKHPFVAMWKDFARCISWLPQYKPYRESISVHIIEDNQAHSKSRVSFESDRPSSDLPQREAQLQAGLRPLIQRRS